MSSRRLLWVERVLAVVVAALVSASVWALTDVSAEQSSAAGQPVAAAGFIVAER
jgi:hypothetical protein